MERCLVITLPIRDLALKLQGETPASIANLIGLWQEKNNKGYDEHPDAAELNKFRADLKKQKDKVLVDEEPQSKAFNTSKVLSLAEQELVNLDFNPTTRVDRAALIARFFSNEITSLLEEELAAIKDRLNTTQDEIERLELLGELESTSRRAIIDRYRPEGIFRRVKERYFDNYIGSPRAERVDAEFRRLVQDPSLLQDYTEEELKQYAEELADENLDKFLKVSDNFKALAEEASSILLHSEGLKITFGEAILDANYSEDTIEPGEENSEDLGSNSGKEESVKDGWMINYLHVSGHESLSQEVRKVINSVPRIDKEGFVETDDLGFDRYLDSSYVVATLIDGLRKMVNTDDMMPALEEIARNKPWVNGIILKLEGDERLFSQFYLNFRKDFMPYTVIRSTQSADGRLLFKTVSINSPEGIYYLLDAWRDNYESGAQLSRNSIYDKEGIINNEKVNKNYNTLLELTNRINSLDTTLKLDLINNNSQDFLTLVDLLLSVGIQPNIDVLVTALNNVSDNPNVKIADPINRVLDNLNVILKGLKDDKVEKGKDNRIDLINNFGGAYNSIALMLANVTEDAIESSVHLNGKSYYSHVTPAYLEKIIKNLKSVHGNEQRFLEFINQEYGQYQFFYKNGKWLNGWLDEIVNNPKMRDTLSHDMVLSYNNKSYMNWDALDYALVLLEKYNLQDKVDKGNAWYYVPIMSDTQSAEFIHFKKYRTGDELDEDANKRHFSDIIIDKMSNLVLQEFDRIKMVLARDDARTNGDLRVLSITNFDIVRRSDGTIKNKGGAEFKFLPKLNDIVDANGNSFLDTLGIMSQNNDPNLRLFIRDNLRTVMESSFLEAYDTWAKIGMLDKNNNGSYLYLPYNNEANAKEALKEYFYNSTYATSLIEELVITDLAQYKNLEDFLKRFKEVHAPALRLNTESKYGRKFERTVYLADAIKPSDFIDDIKDILQERVNQGLMLSTDRDYILSQYKKINVADALAYRSIDSYRSIMDMQGKWTDDMERTYLRFKNNEWTLEDFQTLWLPIKPFVYTQVKVDSGIDSFGPIKLGVQHKNSEYLLLAMNELIGGKLHSSPKLRAIAKFMLDANIDVIQFESAVKVGLQGAVDLNGLESYDEIYGRLQDSTHLEGEENPNVIHTIPYEDYGVLVQTPEHSIDSQQGIGTQLRKLITADMADDIKVTVGNKTLTKKEWIDLYNKINTENILLQFISVDNIFKDPKKIELILVELINSSPRYGRDLLLACTLDENGQFNVPLFDPVQSGRVQQLINSILKSRVTKLKTKGGSLIQLSNFGFTNELNIVYEGKGKDKRIKHFECYMPWYTRKYFKELIDPKTGQLDINKIPDNLRRLIGYRT